MTVTNNDNESNGNPPDLGSLSLPQKQKQKQKDVPSNEEESQKLFELDPDIESKLIVQFDALVARGELMWAPYTTDLVQRDGFSLAFQLSPHLAKKPIQERDDEVRKTGKGKNPFINPDPEFVVSSVGPNHTLLLNKFCVYRPSLILHTKEFVPQEDVLDAGDINAAWSLLRHLRRPKSTANEPGYLMIYNCGFDSGSSQGHKHMQLWRRPTVEELGFSIFPDHVMANHSKDQIATDLPGTPIRHYVLRLSDPNTSHVETTSKDVYAAYQKLLVEIHKCHDMYGSTSHNVALTEDWICLIPRRSNGLDRGAGANAAAALGTIWITTPEEKEIWLNPRADSHLSYIGVPRG